MHYTITLGKRNTSVRIRDDLLALWYVLCFPDKELNYAEVRKEVRRFLSRCLREYHPKNPYYISSEGVTEFVNTYIVGEVLEGIERIRYFKVLKMLKKTPFKSGLLSQLESLCESVEGSTKNFVKGSDKIDSVDSANRRDMLRAENIARGDFDEAA